MPWDLILSRSLHFIFIMLWYGALLAAHLQTRRTTVAQVRRVALLTVSALVAGWLLGWLLGLVLWFGVGKPAEFYTSNGLFMAKVTLFIVALALGIAGPTRYWSAFKKAHGDSTEEHATAKWLKLLRGCSSIAAAHAILGSMVANGVGYKPKAILLRRRVTPCRR